MSIEKIQSIFQIRTNHEYPFHNKIIFEEFFLNYFTENNIDTKCIYLPILWTNFYISRDYGNSNMDDLQACLDSLNRNKKYFTIIQYDDGILQNIDDLDITVFGSGGGGSKVLPKKNLGYPIPLICQPNPSINKNRDRDILCSFVGVIKGRHFIREKIKSLYEGTKDFFISESLGYDKFKDVLERSKFSLCPRGYGATSFRICEALQHGSIPIYVYDKDWTPWYDEFNFDDIGIKLPYNMLDSIQSIIYNKTDEEVAKYIENGKKIYKEFFDFNGCANKIVDKLNK